MKYDSLKPLLVRSFREGLLQLRRHAFLSGSVLFLGALIVFLLNMVFALNIFAETSLDALEKRADFSVALEQHFEPFELEGLENELKTLPVHLQILPEEKREGIVIAPRIWIQFQDLTAVRSAFDILKNPRYSSVLGPWDTDSERAFVQLIEKLLHVRNMTETVALWLSLFFLAGGVVLMIHTFQMVLFSRKDEIAIAALVGAQRTFIAAPFWVEGMVLALGATLLGMIGFVFALREIAVLPGGLLFLELWDRVFFWEIVGALCVGFLGSFIAVRKHLKKSF